jgi:DNA-binding winged helix-turn-helix (wHTH) protein
MIGRRAGRRWKFGKMVLDEPSWTLTVDGVRVGLEAKPLELLHELLLNAGSVVTKDQLLNTVWSGVSVVEASLPTAVLKLRRALGDDRSEHPIIETVPRIGYRLAIPVKVGQPGEAIDAPLLAVEAHAAAVASPPRRPWRLVVCTSVFVAATGALASLQALRAPPPPARPGFTQSDANIAIRKLDVEKVEALLQAGWNPNTPFDDQGNGAMTVVLNICEWNPGHDRQRLLLMAWTLFEGGARLDHRNVWGDTPYSIAKAKRYCGRDHPVTTMLRAQCFNGFKPPRDKCLATYELNKR